MDFQILKDVPAEIRAQVRYMFVYSMPYAGAPANFGYCQRWQDRVSSIHFENVILDSSEKAFGTVLNQRWSTHTDWIVGGNYCWSLRPLQEKEREALATASDHAPLTTPGE